MSKWNKTPETSPVWIDPGDKPLEYIFALRDIPPRPNRLDIITRWQDSPIPDTVPQKPQSTIYIGAVEWSWSPAHSRMDNYYLSKSDEEWILYLHLDDDLFGEWIWHPVAWARPLEFDDWTVSFWMIHDLLVDESKVNEVDEFHLISGEGLFRVGDFRNLASLVWPEGAD